MYSFNANVAGYMSDVYVQWSTTGGGGWEGSFDYNTGWIKRDGVAKVLEPGRYRLADETDDYDIDVTRVVPQGDDIYRAYFTGLGGMPPERSWNRARDVTSTKSWDEQVMERIKSGEKTAGEQWVEDIENQERSRASCLGCLVFLMLAVSVLVVIDYFYDIF
ncbi:MAG: hypothetical protein V3R73_06090 [Sphingomonadales bacterium]